MGCGLWEFVTSAHNLWTRKRHDRDLRIVSTLLLRTILAPKRLSAFLEKRSQYFELKKAAKEQNNAQAETKASVSKKHAIDTMHYYIKELTWAICLMCLLFVKVDRFSSSSTGTNKGTDSIKKTQKVTRSLRSAVQQSNPFKVCTADEQPYYMPEASDDNDDDDTDDKDSLTIHQCAPLAYITNTAVALIGPQQNQWATFPSVDEKDQSLHISTDVLYTLFSGDFKIPAETPKGEITSKREAVDWRRKRDVFGAFFKLPKIQQAMESKKLTLAYRVTFVNRHTVRVLGTRTVTTGDSERRDKETAKEKEQDNSSGDDDSNIGSDEGTSVAKVASKGQASRSKGKGRAGAGLSGKNRSAKARKKKKQKAQRRKRKSQDEERRPRKRHAAQKEDKADIEELKTNLGQRIRRLASRLPGLLKECGTLEEKRVDIGRQFRRRTKMKEAWDPELYQELQAARAAIRHLYVAEMHCIGKDVAKGIVPDDKIESTVQKTILESLQNNNPLAVAGIDPGHVVAATAVLTTTTHIFNTIQQYTDGLIAPLPPSFASSSATTQEQGIPQQSSISLPTPLPKPHTYTSKKKNSATFATKHQKRREIFKRKGIDDADRRYKEGRTRELRHKIYHSKLASAWRLPGIKPTLHFFGSWRAGNKRFKKHQQGASKKLKQELDAPENSHLCITDEYRSSKTCPYCHEPTTLQKYRGEDGKLRPANGALKCTNLTCPSRSQTPLSPPFPDHVHPPTSSHPLFSDSRRDTSPGAQLSPREAG
ncbi:hypothetical protein BDB00DRAFT_914590 [Zychaea mexicana]|uniref:uncharacterized protein n=1 Tax=Zychaea mexicana TaxID=64656 RepID=UPI0022FE987B|nr:uncharacterized protein BDB00DRAFT_914590 [Zychaea mexicana]KAI9491222.1 hypothetical protein BDB00DRAFT_914590 [Zychaea mexicana]